MSNVIACDQWAELDLKACERPHRPRLRRGGGSMRAAWRGGVLLRVPCWQLHVCSRNNGVGVVGTGYKHWKRYRAPTGLSTGVHGLNERRRKRYCKKIIDVVLGEELNCRLLCLLFERARASFVICQNQPKIYTHLSTYFSIDF
jgi:hypothetical protein